MVGQDLEHGIATCDVAGAQAGPHQLGAAVFQHKLVADLRTGITQGKINAKAWLAQQGQCIVVWRHAIGAEQTRNTWQCWHGALRGDDQGLAGGAQKLAIAVQSHRAQAIHAAGQSHCGCGDGACAVGAQIGADEFAAVELAIVVAVVEKPHRGIGGHAASQRNGVARRQLVIGVAFV